MSEPPVGIAVVGAGPWGLTLAGAFARLSQVELRWICDLQDEPRARACAAHPDARITADLTDALGDPAVDAVIVAVDPARHHAVSLQALDAGKHLFVEKPLALSARDAEQIHSIAAARARVLSVGHVLLHNNAVRQARQIIAKGTLGEPLSLASRRTTLGPPRRPDSGWWALAPHDVSLALYLFADLPTSVVATASAWSEAQEDNAATAALHFPAGRTATIHVARGVAHKRRDVTITGTLATLTFDELAATDQALRLWTPREGVTALAGDRVDALRAQCQDFLARIARCDSSGDGGAHAVDVVRVLEAGERSMRQDGRVQPIGASVRIGVAEPAGAAVRDRAAFEAA